MKPRIARSGVAAPPGNGGRDEEYLRLHGITPLEKKALGVQLLREDRERDTEFVTISYWESMEAMSRFAGPTRAASITCRATPSS